MMQRRITQDVQQERPWLLNPPIIVSLRFISELAKADCRDSLSFRRRRGSSQYRRDKETAIEKDSEDGQTLDGA